MNIRCVVATLMMTTLALSPIVEAKRVGGGKSYGMSRSYNGDSSSANRNYNQNSNNQSGYNQNGYNQSRPAPVSPQPQRSGPGVGSMVAAGAAGAAAGYMLGHSNDARAQQGTVANGTTQDPYVNNASMIQQQPKNNFPWFWIALLAIAAFFIFRRFAAKKANANNNPFAPNNSGQGFNTGNSPAGNRPFGNNNNDAASFSRPNENTNVFGQSVGNAASGSAFTSNGNQLPDGTEPAAFLRQARAKFLHLQSMNSASNVEEVRRYFTPEMYTAIREDILSNDELAEFPQLTAQVIESGNENGQYFASVQFNGTVSESLNAQPVPFSEIWHFVKPLSSNEWLVAGIQQN